MAKHTGHSNDETRVDPTEGTDQPHRHHDRGDHGDRDGHGDHDGVVGVNDTRARDRFGGLNVGAAFFGWIVSIGVTALLVGIVGAILVAAGSSVEVTQSDAEREAGTIGLSTAIVLLVILALAYYAGGYVAGRMSRFDGARQGLGVWVLGLVVAIVAIALGAIFGSKYNVLDRVNLPSIPISTDQLSWGAVIAAVAVLLATLLFAILGGILGHRYHDRVDRAVRR